MKLILCGKCWDVFKLIKEKRICSCGAIAGMYVDDVNAIVTENAISLALGNGSLDKAISDMGQLQFETNNTAKREDYYSEGKGKISHAWVRPNDGPGNPHTKVVSIDEVTRHPK